MRLDHVPGGGPGPAVRVVQLRGGRVVLIAVAAAHHEHPAIEEPHRGVARAGRAHRPGGDPGACWLGNADGVGRCGSLGVELGATTPGRLGLGSRSASGSDPRPPRTTRHQCEHGHDRRRGECGSGDGPTGVDGSRPGAGADRLGGGRSSDGRPPTARATAAESTDCTPVLANARTRSSNRSSNRVMSSIAKLRSKAAKQSGQPGAGAGGAHVQSARQLRGIESRDIAQRDQRAVLRASCVRGHCGGRCRRHGSLDPPGWSRIGSRATEISSTRPRRRRRDSCRASLTAIEMSHGRRRSGSRIVSQLPPGDRPGRLDRLLGELGVAARDDEADAAHVGVVGVHDAREGDLVAVRGEAHQPRRGLRRASGHGHHRPIDARDRRSDSRAAMSERWCGAGTTVSTLLWSGRYRTRHARPG